jgi:excisionase family DNA binding protein
MASQDDKPWLSQKRGAIRAGIPYGTFRAVVRAGELGAIRHGRGYLVSVASLDAWLARRGVQPRPGIIA